MLFYIEWRYCANCDTPLIKFRPLAVWLGLAPLFTWGMDIKVVVGDTWLGYPLLRAGIPASCTR